MVAKSPGLHENIRVLWLDFQSQACVFVQEIFWISTNPKGKNTLFRGFVDSLTARDADGYVAPSSV